MKITTLLQHSIQVGRSREIEHADTVETVPVFMIAMIDQQTGDQIQISFREDVRDYIVRELTGGVVIANGGLRGMTKPS